MPVLRVQIAQVTHQGSYFTASVEGLTEFQGGQPSEIMSVESWLKERYLYRAITKLRFFQEFWRYKLFRIWKTAKVKASRESAAAIVGKRLLTLRGPFRELILNVQETALDYVYSNSKLERNIFSNF